MKKIWSVCSLLVVVAGVVGLASSAGADNRRRHEEVVRAVMVPLQEVPALSTGARGSFRAVIDEDAGTITYSMSYDGFESAVLQSHLHFGQHHVNGGISVFLCSNLPNPPPGTQACPAPPAEISGVIMAANVIGPVGQGIAAGEFAELLAAIRSGNVYANVHTTTFPGGEIRGQVR